MLGYKWAPLGVFIYVYLLNERWRSTSSNSGYYTFRIFHTNIYGIYKCRVMWNALEHALEKSRDIRKILKRSVMSSPLILVNVLVAFLSSKAWICALNCHKFWIGSQRASLSGRPFHLTRSSVLVVGWNVAPCDRPGLPLLPCPVGLSPPWVPYERCSYLDPLHLYDTNWVNLHGRLGGTWSSMAIPPYNLVSPPS